MKPHFVNQSLYLKYSTHVQVFTGHINCIIMHKICYTVKKNYIPIHQKHNIGKVQRIHFLAGVDSCAAQRSFLSVVKGNPISPHGQPSDPILSLPSLQLSLNCYLFFLRINCSSSLSPSPSPVFSSSQPGVVRFQTDKKILTLNGVPII